MAELIYTQKPGSIAPFLKHIRSAGDPGKVTIKYLETSGFKTKNDRYLVGVLRGLGLIDGSGTTTDLWRTYRSSSNPKAVIGQAIRSTYSGLFHMYPDAQLKDDEALRNWMKSESPKASENVINRALGTFRALCAESDFDAAAPIVPPAPPVDPASALPVTPLIPPIVAPQSSGPSININIQLELPATDDVAVYNALFEAMKTHLFPDA